MEKYCPQCASIQPVENFYKAKNRPMGLSGYCKPCSRNVKQTEVYKNNQNERRKEYYLQKKEAILSKLKLKYNKNREKALEYAKNRRLVIIVDKEARRIYERNRRQSSPMFRMKANLRSRILCAFKRSSWHKSSGSEKLLGVPYEVAKQHIQKRFKKGMSWLNYGEWEIDHIVPLSSAKTEAELITLCHYRNLQPLWKSDNRKKAGIIFETQLNIAI